MQHYGEIYPFVVIGSKALAGGISKKTQQNGYCVAALANRFDLKSTA
jgi:hypothetical protein